MKKLSKNAQQVIIEAAVRALVEGEKRRDSKFTDVPSFRQGIMALLQTLDAMNYDELGGTLDDLVYRAAFDKEKELYA